MTGALCWKFSYTFQFLLSKQTAKTNDLKQTSRERPPSAKYYHMRTSTSNITEQAICPAVVNQKLKYFTHNIQCLQGSMMSYSEHQTYDNKTITISNNQLEVNNTTPVSVSTSSAYMMHVPVLIRKPRYLSFSSISTYTCLNSTSSYFVFPSRLPSLPLTLMDPSAQNRQPL